MCSTTDAARDIIRKRFDGYYFCLRSIVTFMKCHSVVFSPTPATRVDDVVVIIRMLIHFSGLNYYCTRNGRRLHGSELP